MGVMHDSWDEEHLVTLPVPRLVAGPHKELLRIELARAEPSAARGVRLRPSLAAAAALVGVVLVAGLLLMQRPPRALASTLDAVQEATTLVAKMAVTKDDGSVGGNSIYWKAPDSLRIDFADGGPYDGETWVIVDEQVTVLNPQRRTAVVLKNLSDRYRPLVKEVAGLTVPDTLEEMLRHSKAGQPFPGPPGSDTVVVPLAGRPGMGDQAMELVLDRESHLPLELRAESDGEGTVLCRYEWNTALGEDVFSPALPEGVEARVVDGARQAPPLSIAPGKGVGPVRLGMPAEEVVELLGEPDRVLNGVAYQYFEYGLEAVVGQGGVWLVGCLSGDGEMSPFLGFSGTTPEGIGLGSTEEQVVAAYGAPPRRQDNAASGISLLSYRNRGIEFELHADPQTMRVTLVRVVRVRP